MSDVVIDCPACGGMYEYGGQRCCFCSGGTMEVRQENVGKMEELAAEYCEFIDSGGKAEDWDG